LAYYMILRFIWAVYFIGITVCILRATSHSIFSCDTAKSRFIFLFKSMLVSVVWPLAMFSNAGRSFITSFIKLKEKEL